VVVVRTDVSKEHVTSIIRHIWMLVLNPKFRQFGSLRKEPLKPLENFDVILSDSLVDLR
jgi:hypothetical protein